MADPVPSVNGTHGPAFLVCPCVSPQRYVPEAKCSYHEPINPDHPLMIDSDSAIVAYCDKILLDKAMPIGIAFGFIATVVFTTTGALIVRAIIEALK